MDTLNGLLSSFGGYLKDVLPLSPFSLFFSNWIPPDYIKYLNWFFPVSECLDVLEIWVGSVSSYYIYSLLMRWIKVID